MRAVMAWIGGLCLVCFGLVGLDGEEAVRLRVGFLPTVFSEMHPGEAKGAVRAWGVAAAKELGVGMVAETVTFEDEGALAVAVKGGEVDAVAMSPAEFLRPGLSNVFGGLFVPQVGGRRAMSYVVLVRGDSGVTDLRGLKGRQLVMLSGARMTLGEAWLEGVLADGGLGRMRSHFGGVSVRAKLSGAVLPAFFGQADAVLVYDLGFELMKELNPQLGLRLKVLVASPGVPFGVFGLARAYVKPENSRVIQGIGDLHKTAAGHQILTVFQSERLLEVRLGEFAAAGEILSRYRGLVEGEGVR